MKTCMSASPLLVAALLFVLGGVGCSEEAAYPRSTPDELVQSTVEMVKAGDARMLPDLINADDERMRRFLDRMGILLGNLQGLGDITAQKFPDEIAALRARALEAAEDPGGASLFESFMGAGDLFREDPGLAFQTTLGQILTDPYGWIEITEGRLSTISDNEEAARVLLDDRDLFPGGVISLRLVDGEGEEPALWHYQLPTHIPPLSIVMPRSDEMWEILDHMVAVLNNTIVDLIEDTQAGRLKSLEAIGKEAQDKTVVPLVMVGAAYARQMEAWNRYDDIRKAYSDRVRLWVVAKRMAHKGEGAREVSRRLQRVIGGAGEDRLFDIAWKPRSERRKYRFKEMSDEEFDAMVLGWLEEDGLTLDLSEDAFAWTAIGEAIDRWHATELGIERLGPLPGSPATPIPVSGE